jgi:hypothetical protein
MFVKKVDLENPVDKRLKEDLNKYTITKIFEFITKDSETSLLKEKHASLIKEYNLTNDPTK